MLKPRLEAFSDGVFAVAATLLVLELHVPHVGSGPLWPQLLAQWPAYTAYVVSFMTIGIIWVNHHMLFALVTRVDRPLLFLNVVLLMTVSLCPFTTALVSEWVTDAQEAHVAAAAYGAVFTLMGLSFGAIWTYAVLRRELVAESLRSGPIRALVARFTIGNLGYLAGIAIAFYSGPLSMLLYALVALYYVSPVLPEALPRTAAGDADGRG